MSLQKDEATISSDSIYYKFIRFLHRVIVSIRSNMVLFIICMLVGIVPILIKNHLDADLYKASFTVSYDELVRKIYGDRIAKINVIVQEDRTQLLSNLLQVDEKTAAALKNIEGKNILGEDLTKDLNTDRVPFIVELTVDDSSKIVPLQNGIVKFLETGNEFMATRKAIKVQENSEELTYINKQLGIIDTAYRSGKVGESGFIAATPPSSEKNASEKAPGSLIEFSYQLYKRKQELLRRQRMPQTLTILDDAIVPVQKKHSTALMVIIGAAAGFILFSIVAAIIVPAFRFKER